MMSDDDRPITMRERFDAWKADLETRAIQHANNPHNFDFLLAALAVGYLIYRAITE